MATQTNEQIEQKKQQLKKPAEEAKHLNVEAGALPLDEDDLDQAAGGLKIPPVITT